MLSEERRMEIIEELANEFLIYGRSYDESAEKMLSVLELRRKGEKETEG